MTSGRMPRAPVGRVFFVPGILHCRFSPRLIMRNILFRIRLIFQPACRWSLLLRSIVQVGKARQEKALQEIQGMYDPHMKRVLQKYI